VTHDHLAATDPLAVHLLDLLACFAPDELPAEVLFGLPGSDDAEVAEALAHLASYSMISAGDDAVSVHRLVQSSTLLRLDAGQRDALCAEAAALLETILLRDGAAVARLVPHAVAALPGASPALPRVVDHLAAGADYATAIVLQERLTGHDPSIGNRMRLARLTGQTGDAAGARDRYADLLPASERANGPDHPDTLAIRAGVAEWTGEAGDQRGALDAYRDLLPDLRRVRGEHDLVTIHARLDEANWILHLGDPARACDLFAALLPTATAALGADDDEVLVLRGCLADATGRAGDPAAARELSTRLLDDRRRTRGSDHPETLATARDLATWTAATGDPAAARDQLADLLPRLVRAWGPEHPTETLTALEQHADLVGRAGDPAAALDRLAALLPVRERVSGAAHPLTDRVRHDLARWAAEAEHA
jgi:hypothetical protein